MANVIKYDRDQVIERAMLLFWERGFYATSTRDLQQVTDLRPGSFYAAFGSKEGLFQEALLCYADQSYLRLQDALEQADSTLQGIRNFIRQVVIEQRGKAPSDICMLVKSVAELADDAQELAELPKTLIQKNEQTLKSVLETAKAAGELPATADCGALAAYLLVQIMGMRVYLRSSDNLDQVNKMIDELFCSEQ